MTVARPSLRMNDEIKSAFLKNEDGFGLDLVAIALKQGRDHGVPGYTTVRSQCGLGKVSLFS